MPLIPVMLLRQFRPKGCQLRLVASHLIRSSTQVCRSPLTPELQLHLITPSCELWSATAETSPFHDPFWAFYWPGGQALARFVLDHPETVAGKCVLDVGSGSGACAIAACKSNARRVVANDIDPVACDAIHLNAGLNKVSLEVESSNLLGSATAKWDCFLVGDMFYDSDIASLVLAWLTEAADQGKLVLVGDPGRHLLFSDWSNRYVRLTRLAEYHLPESTCLENNGFKTAQVWQLGVSRHLLSITL